METQPQMINLSVLAFVLALELFGCFAHWLRLRIRGVTKRGYFVYIMGEKPGSSSLMIGMMFMSAVVVAATDAAYLINPSSVWQMVVDHGTVPTLALFAISGAVSHGYMLDSGSNGVKK